MALRIRTIDGEVVALCAAESEPQEGDLYLDDNIHHALTLKFDKDFKSELKAQEEKPEMKTDTTGSNANLNNYESDKPKLTAEEVLNKNIEWKFSKKDKTKKSWKE
jgi:hypothetical protein